MGKKTHPNNNNNRSAAASSAGATQQHLSRESGRIRQRQEQNQPYYNNNHHDLQEQEEQKPPQQTAQEKYADNVNLLVLNLNSNPEQIYRQTIGKMLHSMTTPFTEKFKINSSEKQQEGGEENAAENDKKNKKNKKNNKNNKNQQATTSENNDNHDLSPETASFFSEDQQTATMLIHFPDKFSAKKLAQKLNQGQLFAGTSTNNNENNNNASSAAASTTGQLHASVVPTESLKPRYEPCALRITELTISSSASSTQNTNNSNKNSIDDSSSSTFTLSQLQQYLSSNPGFLSVSKVARIVGNGGSGKKNQERKPCFVATYADSGAALQARALMSGRAFHGVHLLLELIEEENEQIVPLV